MAAVRETLGDIESLTFQEDGAGPDGESGETAIRPELIGDAIIGRKDVGTSYHLAVTYDDALQGITLVTRGQDLYFATPFHLMLQKLLDLPQPDYHHHRLILDDDGKRLAKSAQSKAIRAWRDAGSTPEDVFKEISWTAPNT